MGVGKERRMDAGKERRAGLKAGTLPVGEAGNVRCGTGQYTAEKAI